jgi:CheY-like chemotaxis protein
MKSEGLPMTSSSSTPSGIQAVGDIAFGTHFCQFYRNREDLADTLVPFFVAGLRNQEVCMWVTSAPFEADEARSAMREALPDFDDYEAKGQIEIYDYKDWYLRSGNTAAEVLQGWLDREKRAIENGFQGLRLTGNTFWLERSGWDEFVAYEAAVNEAFRQLRIIALCTYSLDRCCAEDVLDVCRNHQFALTRRSGEWELIESSSLKIAKDELRRLNQDLLNNSAKYMEPEGQIWLSAEIQGTDILVRVRDQGVGISPEILPRIFDLFTQADRSLDRSEGGLGIGLALVRSLVELHGGSVSAASDGPGCGSEFTVRLPILRIDEAPEAPAAQKVEPPPPGRRILVVDDNRDAAESLQMLLELYGHEVRVAHDGEEALAAFAKERPEVVLLDIGLPRLDGFEVARRLRADGQNRDVLLVALTGYGKHDHHLVKPVEPAMLMSLLARPS